MRLIGAPPKTYERPYHLYPGAKVRFYGEKQAYTVRCTSKRYTICTKPFNARKTVLYCIIDWEASQRGPENLVFGAGAETDVECLEMLVRLIDGESELSSRHSAWLDIEKLWHEDWVIIGEGAEASKEHTERRLRESKAKDARS